MKKIGQISVLLLVILSFTLSSCSSSRGGRGCGCNGMNKRPVG